MFDRPPLFEWLELSSISCHVHIERYAKAIA